MLLQNHGFHRARGTLNQSFVDQLVDPVSCFLLAGRGWVVVQIQHSERRVLVDPAPRGRQPTWGGFQPQFLGRAVCQKILDVLTSTESYGFLNPEAASLLDEQRGELRGVLMPESDGIDLSDGEIHWWTFAGGRINSTLRYALSTIEGGWSVVPDNYRITIRGDKLNTERFLELRRQLAERDFWENEQLWHQVSTSLPNYRFSKFQPLVPTWIEREVLASYLLDVSGAWQWLSSARMLR